MIFKSTQPEDKIVSHKILERPWDSGEVGTSMINNKYNFHIVNNHSIFLIVKQMEGFNTDNLIKTCRMYRLPNKIVLDAGTTFFTKKFENFYQRFSICHLVSPYYNCQSIEKQKMHHICQENHEKML